MGATKWDNGAKFMVMADRFGLPLAACAAAVSFGPAAFSSCSAEVYEMTCGYRPPSRVLQAPPGYWPYKHVPLPVGRAVSLFKLRLLLWNGRFF